MVKTAALGGNMRGGDRVRLPVHFLCSEDKIWPELRDGSIKSISDLRLAALSQSPIDCWILRTFYELRDRIDEVSLGPDLRPDRINFASVYDLGRKARLNLSFVVTTQADGYRSALGNFNLRQNGLEPSDETQDWVPHWLQPGIIKRDRERGDLIRKAAYRGHHINLISSLHDPGFADKLAARGIEFDNGTRKDGRAIAWEDYTGVDVLVALRNVTEADLRNKPASKLVNAWSAGVPAILGPEPAYQELRLSPLDYIEASSVGEVLAALDRLQKEPKLYRAMVENGLERAKSFTPERNVDRWISLINGPIARAFEAWNGRGGFGRMLTVGRMLLGEPRRRRKYVQDRDHGNRPLGSARVAERRFADLVDGGLMPTFGGMSDLEALA